MKLSSSFGLCWTLDLQLVSILAPLQEPERRPMMRHPRWVSQLPLPLPATGPAGLAQDRQRELIEALAELLLQAAVESIAATETGGEDEPEDQR